MNKRLMLTAWLCLCAFFSHALDLDKHWWYDFEGKIGDMDVVLSIYVNDNGRLTGNYCYCKYEKKIRLSGSITGQETTLTETAGGAVSGYFSGRIFTDSLDRFEGRWTDAARMRSYDFRLSLRSAIAGSPEGHYPDAGTDQEVEDFMKKTRSAILNGDKVWIAAHASYPLRTTLDGKQRIVIRSGKQLRDNFARIFHAAYREKIRSFCICNLFNNYRGVMLGNGQIWINEVSKVLRIIAINN